MSDDILQGGIEAFLGNLNYAYTEFPESAWRTAGKKTKAQPNGEDIDWAREAGPQWLTAYYQWRADNPHLTVASIINEETGELIPAIEVEINVQVPDTDIILKGYIDRVFKNLDDDSLLIVDLKSGKTAQPSPLQLSFYRLGWLERFGADIRYGAFYSARDGGLDALYDLDQFPPDMVARWLRNADTIIKNDLFLPRVSRDCGWCSLKDECYIWNPAVPRPDFRSDLPAGK